MQQNAVLTPTKRKAKWCKTQVLLLLFAVFGEVDNRRMDEKNWPFGAKTTSKSKFLATKCRFCGWQKS